MQQMVQARPCPKCRGRGHYLIPMENLFGRDEWELKCRECGYVIYVKRIGNILSRIKPAKYIKELNMVPGGRAA